MNSKERLAALAHSISAKAKEDQAKIQKSENRQSEKKQSEKQKKRKSNFPKSEKEDTKTARRSKGKAAVVNPPYGDKADFIKISATLPPEVFDLAMNEVVRRKKAKLKDAVLSAIIREALMEKLGR